LANAEQPDVVKAVPRFEADLRALNRFFEGDSPVEVPVRATNVLYVIYGFGDESKEGFGKLLTSEGGSFDPHWHMELPVQGRIVKF